MASMDLSTSALKALQSSEQQTLLDEIDNLRRQGVSEFVFLPQIVVCGDQSSGKSSVLEGITGVPFPRSDTLCTRFATEVVLRQAPEDGAVVSIVPSRDAPDSVRSKLLAFKETLKGLEAFPGLIERAKSEMGLTTPGRAFSKDILRVEISGPSKPKLTVVDLPGLIHSDSKQQSAADVELISDLVYSYMKNPRSIILAVVSAKNDYANQIILKRAKQVDPEGLRTLGLITKPDTLPQGSDSEAEFFNLATNDNIRFRLGWHVTKNRDYATRHWTTEQRDQDEERFFSEGIWKQLPREMVGIYSLRYRLGKILLEQIKRYLPGLVEDILSNLKDCKKRLLNLGDDRSTPEKQRQFLLKLSESFQTLCKAATDGNYDYPFFGDVFSDNEYWKRLRAVVQNQNIDFSDHMRRRGHRRTIVDDSDYLNNASGGFKPSITDAEPPEMHRRDAIRWVRKLLMRSRGRELPGSFNPLLVGELFRDQSACWGKIAREHVEKMWTVSKDFLEEVCIAIMDEETSSALFTHWLNPLINKRLQAANEALDRLLDNRERHPITYNQHYTESLQDIKRQRQIAEFKLGLQRFTKTAGSGWNISEVSKALVAQSHYKDMDEFACSEILDSMEAYYEVALKTFVDNVATQVVEDHLIGNLSSIFTPSAVGQMPSTLVTKITTESSETHALRQQLERKLFTMEQGMEICEKYATHSRYSAPQDEPSLRNRAENGYFKRPGPEDSQHELVAFEITRATTPMSEEKFPAVQLSQPLTENFWRSGKKTSMVQPDDSSEISSMEEEEAKAVE